MNEQEQAKAVQPGLSLPVWWYGHSWVVGVGGVYLVTVRGLRSLFCAQSQSAVWHQTGFVASLVQSVVPPVKWIANKDCWLRYYYRKQPENQSSKALRCCCSVTKSGPTCCDPMDCSMPGLLVPYRLPEFAQVHVNWIGDVIQPSHPLSSPSPLALNLSQHQSIFQALHIR